MGGSRVSHDPTLKAAKLPVIPPIRFLSTQTLTSDSGVQLKHWGLNHEKMGRPTKLLLIY